MSATSGAGNQPDFSMGVQPGNNDFTISVNETQARDDATIQVEGGRLIPANEVVTHFPNTEHPDGNTLRCLEQALLDEAGQGNLTGAAREEALTNLKQGVTGIRGKLLKEGSRADSPIVADTHVDQDTGEKYYKFLMTWEIDVTINGEQKTIRKSQWTITGVKQPTDYSDPNMIRLQQHRAILAVKCHRHLHKAALNPQHKDYTYVRDCVDHLRMVNLVGIPSLNGPERTMMFSSWQLHLQSKGDDRSHQLEESIGEKEAAASLGIRLYNKEGKRVHIYIDQSQEGRKVDETGQKYLKEAIDMENPDQSLTPLAYKRKEQGDLMITRGNQDFVKFMKVLHAKPDEVEALMEADRFQGTNSRGMTFDEVKSERMQARRMQEKIHKRNAKFSGKKMDATLMQLYAARMGDDKSKAVKFMLRKGFTSKASFRKHMIKELQGENLSREERQRLNDAIKELDNATTALRDCQQGNVIASHDLSKDSLDQNPYLTDDMRAIGHAFLEASNLDPDNLPVSREVTDYQGIVTGARSVIASAA